MEDSCDEGAAAALGLSPRVFVDDVLDMVADFAEGAIEYCLQEAAAPGILGAAKADEKAAELERGINAIRHVVMDVLDNRMDNWEKYCLERCFIVPEGFVVPEDDNSCAKESRKDGTSDSDLDVELDFLRRKLESANKESENLQRELSSLERQTTYKRKLDSSIAEIQKLFEDKFVHKNYEVLAKAIPILQHKLMGMNKKRTETGSLVDEQVCSMNSLRGNKRLALEKGCTARTDDIQEIVKILQE